MPLPIHPPFPPMEARSVEEAPVGDEWQYEPKWDGFRCLVFRDGEDVELQSKAGQPLARYFPEIVEAVLAVPAERFVLDGELVVPNEDGFSFDALLQRLHPAASRVKKLAVATPAILIVFDLLVGTDGVSLVDRPLAQRRALLEKFAAQQFKKCDKLRLSPAVTAMDEAGEWLGGVGPTLDGIMAKRRDLPYCSGNRDGMQKIKNYRSADCVVGGFRYAKGKDVVGSLLLGLYDEVGKLNHVGFSSSFKTSERPAITKKLEALIGPPGFTGSAPGGPSRWSPEEDRQWEPLKTKLVVEVSYDHFTGGRFRHGTKVLRWRPDKAPEQCTMDQLRQKSAGLLALLGK
ncbi:MAG TPA: ATP-dependent DNA ligase [Chthoniobacteraceae bacterium]|jgi:ATP-dependent DNA ligase|nr:ATP-dependent DNA ligase [Chthoniobacteraceae bacterium]